MPAPATDEVVGRVAAAASESLPMQVRALNVLDEMRALVPFDAAEIASVDPATGAITTIASEGYPEEALAGMHCEEAVDDLHRLGMPETGTPYRMRDLPCQPEEIWAVREVVGPAGFAEGLTMCLCTRDQRFTGLLNLSVSDPRQPSDVARQALRQLGATLAHLTDPGQQGALAAHLISATGIAVGLDRRGRILRLPGTETHPLLDADGDLMTIARQSASAGRWSRFIWPDNRAYYSVRVVPFDDPDQPFAAVVSLGEMSIDPLSPRELEILTLAAEGLSNSEIGDRLFISSRTVSTHVERILSKLDVPTRAAAAAHAISTGLVLGNVTNR